MKRIEKCKQYITFSLLIGLLMLSVMAGVGGIGVKPATAVIAPGPAYVIPWMELNNATHGLTPFMDLMPHLHRELDRKPNGTYTLLDGTVATYYNIKIKENKQQLHSQLNKTTIWGYDGLYPGQTIQAITGQPIVVNYTNDLRDTKTWNGLSSTYEQLPYRTTHYFPIDPNLVQNRPSGSPFVVTHLHGGNVAPDSDGWLADATLNGFDNATRVPILPGQSELFYYPNGQNASTLWYHDHSLGITRLNVIMGLAGFYMIDDSTEAALEAANKLPAGDYDMPIVIQDRDFWSNGSWYYPPAGQWRDEWYMGYPVVNGKVAPYLVLNATSYRFHFLDGSNARTYKLRLSNNATFQQIGVEGGLYPSPVTMNNFTIVPAERFDCVMNFTGYANGTVLYLMNDAGAPVVGPTPGLWPQLPVIMKFIIVTQGVSPAVLPATFRPLMDRNVMAAQSKKTQNLTFDQLPDPTNLMGFIWVINGKRFNQPIDEFSQLGTTEIWNLYNLSPADLHPFHIHLTQFQILDRQALKLDPNPIYPTVRAGFYMPVVDPLSPVTQPLSDERGWKDTARLWPGTLTRVVMKFETLGFQMGKEYVPHLLTRYPFNVANYVNHCHMIEHEDNEMMRAYNVWPAAEVKLTQLPIPTYYGRGNTVNISGNVTAFGFPVNNGTNVGIRVTDVNGLPIYVNQVNTTNGHFTDSFIIGSLGAVGLATITAGSGPGNSTTQFYLFNNKTGPVPFNATAQGAWHGAKLTWTNPGYDAFNLYYSTVNNVSTAQFIINAGNVTTYAYQALPSAGWGKTIYYWIAPLDLTLPSPWPAELPTIAWANASAPAYLYKVEITSAAVTVNVAGHLRVQVQYTSRWLDGGTGISTGVNIGEYLGPGIMGNIPNRPITILETSPIMLPAFLSTGSFTYDTVSGEITSTNSYKAWTFLWNQLPSQPGFWEAYSAKSEVTTTVP